MNTRREAPLIRTLSRWLLLLAVLGSGAVVADVPGQPWRDGSGRSAGAPGGPPPHAAPRRHDSGPRAERGFSQRVQSGYQRQQAPASRQRDSYQRSQPPARLHAPAPRRGVNDVINMVERRYGGKVVGVEEAGNHYRVRLLQRDGRVRTLQVPLDGY